MSEGARTMPIPTEQLERIRERSLARFGEMPERIGRYEVRGELGRGGMAIVYDAWDPQLARPVALKVIDRARLESEDARRVFLDRFQNEMRATSGVFHPNLVAVLDAGSDDAGNTWFAMERVEGESLEERLRRRGRLGRSEGLRVAAAIARGLAAAHGHGLVHRDLKPSNVLLPRLGEPKVGDFGLCHCLGSPPEGQPLIVGSPHYLSPEQVRGETVDVAADLFALGAILVRVFSGREPFPALTLEEHLQRVLADPPEGLRELDADVRQLALELMAKRARDRPASAAEVAERLESLASASGAAFAPRSAPAVPRWRRRYGVFAAGATLVAFAAGVAIARNQLVALEANVETRWKQVENQLARQSELLPELVAITERYAQHERATLRAVLEARRGYLASGERDRPRAAGVLEEATGRMLIVALGQPALGADRHYRALSYEVAGTKNRIAVQRARYNEAVGRYNQRLGQLPWSIVRGRLESRRYFSPAPDQLEAPRLDLDAAR